MKSESKKIAFKLVELEQLQADLEHVLTKNIKFYVRMDVRGMIRDIKPVIKEFNETRLEFYKMHGDEKDGMYSLKKDLDESVIKELEKLLTKEYKINLLIKQESFNDIEDDYQYEALSKLFE